MFSRNEHVIPPHLAHFPNSFLSLVLPWGMSCQVRGLRGVKKCWSHVKQIGLAHSKEDTFFALSQLFSLTVQVRISLRISWAMKSPSVVFSSSSSNFSKLVGF